MPELQNRSEHLPPVILNNSGDVRTVGMEIEFAGLQLEEAAEIIKSCYGGKIEKQHRYHYDIVETRYGQFEVELDARILKKMAVNDSFRKFGIEIDEQKLMESVEDILDKVAMTIVPLEIIMPPVKIREMEAMEELRRQLQIHRAEGTGTSWVHAFGMHINIETPDLNTQTLLNYLRAFLLVYPWLLKRLKVDISRRISPFVDPFSTSFTEMILDVDYSPDRQQLIEDYLSFNPTRNRPLDMMPIFAMLDENKVQAAIKGEKNKPRPTFHYRLPNSRIDDPDWSFLKEWNHWLIVEKLASDEEMIHKLSRLYLMRKDKTIVSFNREWVKTIDILLDPDEQIKT